MSNDFLCTLKVSYPKSDENISVYNTLFISTLIIHDARGGPIEHCNP